MVLLLGQIGRGGVISDPIRGGIVISDPIHQVTLLLGLEEGVAAVRHSAYACGEYCCDGEVGVHHEDGTFSGGHSRDTLRKVHSTQGTKGVDCLLARHPRARPSRHVHTL